MRDEIVRLLRSTQRKNIDSLISWLDETDFFKAPASCKYHLACEGGLAKHSHNVYLNLKRLSNMYNINIPEDTIILTGLLHDVCKIGTYEKVGSRYIFKDQTGK